MNQRREPGGFGQDTRALGVAIMGFIAMIVVAALLYILMEPAATSIMDMSAAQASSQEVKDAINLRRQIVVGGIMFFALFLAGVSLIARAVRESGGVR